MRKLKGKLLTSAQFYSMVLVLVLHHEHRAEAREVVARVEVNEVKRVAVKAAMAEAVYGVD